MFGKQSARLSINPCRLMRYFLWVPSIWLAYAAFDYSAFTVLRRANPEAGYAERPTNPSAFASAMNARLLKSGGLLVSEKDARYARAALAQEPLGRVALRTLGIKAETSGNMQQAYNAMAMASKVSRRDVITQLWLAELARSQGNQSNALSHYSAAMLVRPDLQKALFPKMVQELANPDFRAALAPYMRLQPSWIEPYIGTATYSDIDNLLMLIRPFTKVMANDKFYAANARIIYQLAARGDGSEAVKLASEVVPAFNQQKFAMLEWNTVNTDERLGKLAWTFEQTATISSTQEELEGLKLTVAPLAAGRAAIRDIIVTPNRTYYFSHGFSSQSSSFPIQLNWTAECINNGVVKLIWRGSVPPTTGSGTFKSNITTDDACHLVRLTANVVGSESQVESGLTIMKPEWDADRKI